MGKCKGKGLNISTDPSMSAFVPGDHRRGLFICQIHVSNQSARQSGAFQNIVAEDSLVGKGVVDR